MRQIAVLFATLSILACSSNPGNPGDGDGDGDGDVDAGTDDLFAAVTAELEASYPSAPAGVTGTTLVVYNADDERVYEHTIGDFGPDRRVPIASASKLVTGLTLMRLIDAGTLSLADTTAGVLGWSGANGAITLDQLGAFVSGLRAQFLCVYNDNLALADCVQTIENAQTSAAPGAELAYGNAHLHVAARMAEVATGSSWRQIVDAELFAPLGIVKPALVYSGQGNPLVSGGLQATTDEYAEILALLFHRGAAGSTQLISQASMERFTQNAYTGAVIESSPYASNGYGYRYGFASWLECEGDPQSCDVVSSAGAFGFTPWVDYTNDYYAILSMKADDGDGSVFSVNIQQRLRPLIEAALE